MILKKLELGPFASNCYIVGSEATREGIIIDPGAEAEEILKNVRALGLSIKFIVLTHGHIDHIGAVKDVKEATGAEFYVHSDETRFILERPLTSTFGMPYPTLPPPSRLLKGGDSIDVGDLHFLYCIRRVIARAVSVCWDTR